MATEAGPAINPIEQFSIHPVVPISIAHINFSLTNSGLYMLLAVALSCLIAAIGARGGPGVPGRMQALAEMGYEFIAGMVRSAAGEHGMRFFPLVFSIFFFILICNLVGLIPYSFTVTSQIVITAALALLVFFTVVIIGVDGARDGLLQAVRALGRADLHPAAGRGDRGHSPSSCGPLSHSVRLFANMLAGHITLNVFGGFVVMLLGAGAVTGVARDPALRHDDRALRPRIARRLPAGLRVRHADLHVSQRRASPRRSLTVRSSPTELTKTIGATHGTA